MSSKIMDGINELVELAESSGFSIEGALNEKELIYLIEEANKVKFLEDENTKFYDALLSITRYGDIYGWGAKQARKALGKKLGDRDE